MLTILRRPAAWPWWLQVIAVYVAARLVSVVAVMAAAAHQEASYWTQASPGYFDFVGRNWDAQWYHLIAQSGYPTTLPRGADGVVLQNQWAFFPLFPFTARGVMVLTHLPWQVVAPLLATVAGGVGMLLLYRLVAEGAPRACAAAPHLPLLSVLLVSVFPTSVVLQVGYTESFALVLILAVLLAVVRRSYWWAMPALIALGLTRAVAVPMAAVVAVHLGLRVLGQRRGTDRWRADEVLPALLLLPVAAISGVLWPVVTGLVTGESDGYVLTQEAWRGVHEVVPFAAWGYTSQYWFGRFAVVTVMAIIVLFLVLWLTPAARRLGPELYTWLVAYPLWLAAVVEPGTSEARFLLLAVSFAPVTAGLIRRPGRLRSVALGTVVVVMLALQVVWLFMVWRIRMPSSFPP